MQLQIRALAAAALACGAWTGTVEAACTVDRPALAAKLDTVGVALLSEPPLGAKPPPKLKFPKIAELNIVSGEVSVLLLVKRDGTIADRVVVCADPFGYFEHAVLSWAAEFAFTPASAEDKALYRGVIVRATFRFK